MATTTTTPNPSRADPGFDASSRTRPATASGPLLVGTDGSASSEPALLAARMLATRLGARVDVVAVLEPIPMYTPPLQLLALPTDLDTQAMERLRDDALSQSRELIGPASEWRVDVLAGEPASTVKRVAKERGACMLLTGVSRHGVVDRVFGQDTAAHIASLTDIPMLAVTPEFTRLPRTVIVAIDLDSPAIPDAPAIRALLSEATAVYFVNVKPRDGGIEGFTPSTWERAYDDGITDAAERLMRSVDLPGRVSQQLIRLTGSAAKEIISFADYAKAELIILGQRRHSMLPRRLGGGMPTQILRATACPVLVIPRDGKPAAKPADDLELARPRGNRTRSLGEREHWAARLSNLSRINAGRRVTLEVDDVDFGAQAQAVGYPFEGVDYDHADDRVEIMLGARGTGGGHLTHSVERPVSIHQLERADGEIVALRIATETGQVLISFAT